MLLELRLSMAQAVHCNHTNVKAWAKIGLSHFMIKRQINHYPALQAQSRNAWCEPKPKKKVHTSWSVRHPNRNGTSMAIFFFAWESLFRWIVRCGTFLPRVWFGLVLETLYRVQESVHFRTHAWPNQIKRAWFAFSSRCAKFVVIHICDDGKKHLTPTCSVYSLSSCSWVQNSDAHTRQR